MIAATGIWLRSRKKSLKMRALLSDSANPLKKDTKYKKLNGSLEWQYWSTPGMWNAAGTTDTMRNIVAQFELGLPRGY